MNAICSCCGAELTIVGDGTHPYENVPGHPQALYFCNSQCYQQWHQAHCAYCGQTPRTTTLTVRIVGGPPGAERWFCDVAHRQDYDVHQSMAAK